ncbi:MAG: hypothetical protein RLZZ472_216 [Pseudomonadota bacterium]|jgi:uncharacterized membrane protein
MHITAQRVFVFILTLWVGGIITVDYIVTPTLFATLSDSQVAGMVAGALFRVEGIISMILSVGLIVFANLLVKRGCGRYKNIRWYLLAMLICSVISAFVLEPMMDSLREEALSHGFPVMLSPLAQAFSRLHIFASIVYLLQSLIGLVLLWRLSKPID